MNFSALWTFWASLSDLQIQMRMWIFDRLWQWITRFLYDSLLWSLKLQLKYGQIITKRNFRDYLGWWAPQAIFLWTFMVENTWFFCKYTKFSHRLSKKSTKVHKMCELFGHLPENFWKKSKSSSWNPPASEWNLALIHNTYITHTHVKFWPPVFFRNEIVNKNDANVQKFKWKQDKKLIKWTCTKLNESKFVF